MQTRDLLSGVHPTIAAALRPHLALSRDEVEGMDDMAEHAADVVTAVRRSEYVARLVKHDWHSEFSDDMDAVRKGRTALARLLIEAAELDPMFVLWNRHAPPECKRGAL
jgi:hypothetical protein